MGARAGAVWLMCIGSGLACGRIGYEEVGLDLRSDTSTSGASTGGATSGGAEDAADIDSSPVGSGGAGGNGGAGSDAADGSCTQWTDCQPGFVCSGNICVAGKIARLVVYDTVASRASLWSIKTNFQIGISGAHPWPDWANTYILSVDMGAGILLGKEWIQVSAESKQYTGGDQAMFTISGTADLYMLVDDRWGPAPSWTLGWTVTGWKMIMWESTRRPSLAFSVFRKVGQSGDVTLPQIGATTGYNYVIIAI